MVRSLVDFLIRATAAIFLVAALALSAAAQEKKTPPSASQEPFGEEVTLTERKALFRHNKTSWEEAWVNLVGALLSRRRARRPSG